MILVMIDSFSKKIWTQLMMTDTTAEKTLAVLYGWFCEQTGFPTTLVSDNGPQFTSGLFKDKMAKWGVTHKLTPPYHPASNGLAERAVGLVKDKLKKMNVSSTPTSLYVGLKYINRIHGLTPHASTGRCPYELVNQGPLPSMFPQLTAGKSQSVKSESTVVQHSVAKLRRRRQFSEGEDVIVYDNHTKVSSGGTIVEVLGNNTYLADTGSGPKHVSGDLISRVSETATRKIGGEDIVHQQLSQEDTVEDDNVSIVSESSF